MLFRHNLGFSVAEIACGAICDLDFNHHLDRTSQLSQMALRSSLTAMACRTTPIP